MENKNLEIERKLLIALPDEDMLCCLDGVSVYRISQTYLSAEPGTTERVRKRESNECVEYFHTVKKRISALTRIEDESLIDEREYEELLHRKKEGTVTLEKTRYAFPYKGHIVEIDVFPFMKNVAFLEVELESEDETFELPEFVNVIEDVTSDGRYTNAALARIDRERLPCENN